MNLKIKILVAFSALYVFGFLIGTLHYIYGSQIFWLSILLSGLCVALIYLIFEVGKVPSNKATSQSESLNSKRTPSLSEVEALLLSERAQIVLAQFHSAEKYSPHTQ